MNDLYKKEIIDPGDRASQLAKEICFKSHHNCPAVWIVPHQPGNFRGPVGFLWEDHILREMRKARICTEVENDGAGGKPQFFTLVNTPEAFSGLGWEIIAMTADDFARTGRLPAIIDNEINVKKITEKNYPLFAAMIEGYGKALKEANLVNITGEVAIMKHSITAFCDQEDDSQLILTWGASCIGLAHGDLLLDGSKIKPNMPIVGFWEPGYRCNGGTFFTNLLKAIYGDPVNKLIMMDAEAKKFVEALTIPSQSYAKTICRILGWLPDGRTSEPIAAVAGIAHITGGGVWGKFKEILPAGVGAVLDKMPRPAEVLLKAQQMSWDTKLRLTDYQAYGTLHGGCGMLIVAESNVAADNIIKEAKKDGIKACYVGQTTKSDKNEVIIHSQFMEEKVLSSENPE